MDMTISWFDLNGKEGDSKRGEKRGDALVVEMDQLSLVVRVDPGVRLMKWIDDQRRKFSGLIDQCVILHLGG